MGPPTSNQSSSYGKTMPRLEKSPVYNRSQHTSIHSVAFVKHETTDSPENIIQQCDCKITEASNKDVQPVLVWNLDVSARLKWNGFQNRGLHVFAMARKFSKVSHLRVPLNVTLLELEVINSQSIINALDAVKAQMN
ncbi:4eeaa7b5-991a-4ebc-8b87-e8cc3249aa7f [Sclerotinia trifoliorum]|uniref:4eeaa7b5-991a-4ebc-8b87-e8cc3249aa7f n=1 Tax=Sclerotinia trifoliorum TaxID=28548 RepID=A0A8H2VNU6_9HELO|nr:4eeaa7b5-991a-4ebc-8b87-e8cc3249aa7f [Sclerotinia trifoliorum]